MAALERHEKITLLVFLTVVVSGALFLTGRAYREAKRQYQNENVPLWTMLTPKTNPKRMGSADIDRLAWSRDGSVLWARGRDGVTFCIDKQGQLQSQFDKRWDWGTNAQGQFLFYSKREVFEWQNGKDVLRPDLKRPSLDFENHDFEERSTYLDWNSQTMLGSEARGPVHLWPMQPGAQPISLPAPRFKEDFFSIPYDFAVSPDRSQGVVVYALAQIEGNKWPTSGLTSSGVECRDEGMAVLFDLKTRKPKKLGPVALSFSLPARMSFGRANIKFSPSGRLFVVSSQGWLNSDLQIYDSSSGQKRAWAPLPQEQGLFGGSTERIAFSPDETMLAVAGANGWIQVCSVESGRPLQAFRGKHWSYSLSWSPDSQQLAAAGSGGRVSLWDVASFAPAPKSGKVVPS